MAKAARMELAAENARGARPALTGLDSVDALVGPDVLEGGHADDDVERACLEREPADVSDDRLQAGDLGVREIERHRARSGLHERLEVERIGVRGADV